MPPVAKKKAKQCAKWLMEKINTKRRLKLCDDQNSNPFASPPPTPAPPALRDVLAPLIKSRSELHNTKRSVGRAKKANNSLTESLEETKGHLDTTLAIIDSLIDDKKKLEGQVEALKDRDSNKQVTIKVLQRKISRRQAAALQKLETMHEDVEMSIKKGGTVTREFRQLIQTLRSDCKVAEGNVNAVIQAVASVMGVKITDTVSMHTVHRIALEGYFASHLQVGEAVNKSKG
jgi:hypothetical protein